MAREPRERAVIVRCPGCGAEYELEAEQIPPEGGEFTCTNCNTQVSVAAPNGKVGAVATPAAAQPTSAAPAPAPAPASAPRPPAAPAPSSADDEDIALPPSPLKKFVVALGVLALLGVAWLAWRHFGGGPSREAEELFYATRTTYYADSVADFPKAEEGFKKAEELAGGRYPDARAMLAQVYLTWDEYLKIQADAAAADFAALNAKYTADPNAVPRTELDRLGARADGLRAEAAEHGRMAIAILKEQARHDTGNYTVLLSIADYYRIQRDPEKFEKVMKTAERIDPNAGILYFVRGSAKAVDGATKEDLEAAAALLEKAVSLKGDMLKARVKLARVHYLLGDTARATKLLDEVLAANPRHEIAGLLKQRWSAPPAAPAATPAPADPGVAR